MELTELTISQAHQGLVSKEFSATELCQAYLDNKKGIFSNRTLSGLFRQN